ncbi:GNAT family N-acetyltransferase [Paenibacillus sp. 481]|uniref:GNAT family N-acetyltransferase n=1 Tax=Paenibacillus sp. 481 TaxID=2835869 RepID=UPI001E4057B2|nr:GNAT family N-acetyltransferase [Paenibacillus sp. 481]UHA72752.1 GNAT family N-acetyltransferase [Paenibacillus sp. 481]
MNHVQLKALTVNDDKSIFAMVQEIGVGENGFTNSLLCDTFAEFQHILIRCARIATGEHLPLGYVPQTVFWLYVNNEPVGYGKLRHHLNEQLREMGGHIGYIIRPTQRGKGYGRLMLHELLQQASLLGLQEVLLTCDEPNIRSRKVIEANHGVLAEVQQGRCKYWIKID